MTNEDEVSEAVQDVLLYGKGILMTQIDGDSKRIDPKDFFSCLQSAQDVVDRWDTPKWKDAPATATYINTLRAALDRLQTKLGGSNSPRGGIADEMLTSSTATTEALRKLLKGDSDD